MITREERALLEKMKPMEFHELRRRFLQVLIDMEHEGVPSYVAGIAAIDALNIELREETNMVRGDAYRLEYIKRLAE